MSNWVKFKIFLGKTFDCSVDTNGNIVPYECGQKTDYTNTYTEIQLTPYTRLWLETNKSIACVGPYHRGGKRTTARKCV